MKAQDSSIPKKFENPIEGQLTDLNRIFIDLKHLFFLINFYMLNFQWQHVTTVVQGKVENEK